jgi:hypothetical protein
MDSLALVLGFHLAAPPAADRGWVSSAWDRAYGPLVQALEATPGVPVLLQVTGLLLEALETVRPEAIAALKRIVQRPGTAVACGGWYDPPLGALPERDAVGQIRLSARRLQALLGVRPAGAWLSAWDPTLPRVFARAGLAAALLDEAVFRQAGLGEAGPWRLAVREEDTLVVVPDRARADGVVPCQAPAELVRRLKAHARANAGAVVWMMDARELGLRAGSDLVAWGPHPWVPRLLEGLAGEARWLELLAFDVLLERFPAAGRVALPTALDPRLAALLPDATGGFASGEPLAVPWEAFLARYDESHRLFQRMLDASRDVQRLWAAIRDGQVPREVGTPVLERAVFGLYRSQSASFYEPDPWGGLHDPDRRRFCRASVLDALGEVDRVLGGGGRTRLERRDRDGDGDEEIEIASPDLRLVTAPAAGGALLACELPALRSDLFDTLARREEACHTLFERTPVLPSLVAPDIAGLPPAPLADAQVEVLVEDAENAEDADTDETLGQAPPVLDRTPRVAFPDHFLGPQATPDNVRRGLYPEEGDFLGARYELLLAEPTAGPGPILRLARDGVVSHLGTAHLVRLVKTIRLLPDGHGFEIAWEVSNRLRDPVSTCFATEITLAVDGRASLAVDGGPPGAATGTDQHEETSRIECRDDRLYVQVGIAPAARLWRFPVETIGPCAEVASGWKAAFQGTCLFLSWPITLWGEERRVVTITLSTRVEGAPPGATG